MNSNGLGNDHCRIRNAPILFFFHPEIALLFQQICYNRSCNYPISSCTANKTDISKLLFYSSCDYIHHFSRWVWNILDNLWCGQKSICMFLNHRYFSFPRPSTFRNLLVRVYLCSRQNKTNFHICIELIEIPNKLPLRKIKKNCVR